MAKRKRAKHEQPFSRSTTKSDAAAVETSATPSAGVDELGVAEPFVGKWNRLISTTNWEKGKIICQWREALMTTGAAVTEYSDEAWSQLVGGVTSQHVGRLRRVFQRFGDVADQYEGLHWSHFQACLDWDDAEMWLEGSIQNDWSVSQMRGKRWETVGMTAEEQQAEVEEVAAELNAEAAAEESATEAASSAQAGDPAAPNESAGAPSRTQAVKSPGSPVDDASAAPDTSAGAPSSEHVPKRTRLSVDVESLPDDLAEAFESFKLAIIAHRRENWRDTTPESVVECLESLKQLALSDSD